MLFVNLENMHIATHGDVDRIRRAVEERVNPLGHQVDLVANYDNCRIEPRVADAYAAMIGNLDHHYRSASRYSTSAFLRAKLGEALTRRKVAPHIFETAADARAFIPDGPRG